MSYSKKRSAREEALAGCKAVLGDWGALRPEPVKRERDHWPGKFYFNLHDFYLDQTELLDRTIKDNEASIKLAYEMGNYASSYTTFARDWAADHLVKQQRKVFEKEWNAKRAFAAPGMLSNFVIEEKISSTCKTPSGEDYVHSESQLFNKDQWIQLQITRFLINKSLRS